MDGQDAPVPGPDSDISPDGLPRIHITLDTLVGIREKLAGFTLKDFRFLARTGSGVHPVRSPGRGMEYEESRAYVVGDDIRSMDWRVMARTGEAHTKIFSIHRDRLCNVAVDLSPSMF